jgi:hypothetical protein
LFVTVWLQPVLLSLCPGIHTKGFHDEQSTTKQYLAFSPWSRIVELKFMMDFTFEVGVFLVVSNEVKKTIESRASCWGESKSLGVAFP